MRLRTIFKALLQYVQKREAAGPDGISAAEEGGQRRQIPPAACSSAWDDLLGDSKNLHDWKLHKEVLRRRYLELIRDDRKPVRVPLELKIHESVLVDHAYSRQKVSYQVEEGERASAYVAIPLERTGRLPAVIALHGTDEYGKEQTAGLAGQPEKAYLDHLARRGYVVLAPDHFVMGERTPPEKAYDTRRFYQKHPDWTAVGKCTYENSIAVDVLESLAEADPDRIGVLGHSLGGHSAYFLAAYDQRIRAAACNCSAPTFGQNPQVRDWARDSWYSYFRHLRPVFLRGELPPIDMHEIIALIAPRAFLDISGLNDGHPLTQRQRVLMHMKIMEVYELEKAPQNFAFYVHGQGHSVPYDARQLLYAWMDRHLKKPEAIQPRRVR